MEALILAIIIAYAVKKAAESAHEHWQTSKAANRKASKGKPVRQRAASAARHDTAYWAEQVRGGFLGDALVRVVTWLTHLTGTVTGWALGVGIPSALFVVLVIFLIHDLHPKKGASNRTAYIAMGVGALLVAGVTGIPALAPLASALKSLPANIAGFVNTL